MDAAEREDSVMPKIEVEFLSGRVFIQTDFYSDGAEYFLTKDVNGIIAGRCRKIEWFGKFEMTIADARDLRDRLTRAIILAELSTEISEDANPATSPEQIAKATDGT